MTESLFASLLGMCDKRSLGEVAGALGESDQGVSSAMQSSMASILGGIASKAADPVALRNIMDLAPKESGAVDWSNCASASADPNSSWISTGKRILSTLFGSSEYDVTEAVSSESGLRSGTVSTLLAMAAPMVLGHLNRIMRDEGMTIGGLGNLLQRESGTIRNAMPAGLSDRFWPRTEGYAAASNPVTPRPVPKPGGIPTWVPAIALCALALGAFWLLSSRRPATEIGSLARGTANRALDGLSGLGNFMTRKLPNQVDLRVPEHGTESMLLGYLQDPNARVDGRSFDFDRLTFDSGSANIRGESDEQLNNIAAILKAYPSVKLKIAGYTDNVGNAAQNRELSQARAENVKAALVAKGISADRLEAQGLGESGAGNDSAAATQGRRVTLQVIQK